MSVTVSTPASFDSFVIGNLRCTVRDIEFDSSYSTGGAPLDAEQLGLAHVIFTIPTVKVSGTGSVTGFDYDIDNAKLKANTATGEVADTTNLSAVSAQIVAFGK